MLLEKETLDRYGYFSSSLSNGSRKLVVVKCDYCYGIFTKNNKDRTDQNKVLDRDACRKCRFKKRADISSIKYGVDNPSKLSSVKDKIRNANSDRLKSDEYKKQIKKTNLEKYGVENAMQSKEIKEKYNKIFKNKYGVANPMQVPEIAKKANDNMIKSKINNGTIISIDNKTRPQLAKEQGFSRSHFGKLVVKYGLEKALTMEPQQSSLEVLMENWLQSIDVEYEKQFYVGNYIADFKVGNLLIECDGLYWHSEAGDKPNNYHIKKKQHYTEAGYKSLFFRSDELLTKFDIVKSIILHNLRKTERKIGGRKCEFHFNKVKRRWLDENHLMGKGYGDTYELWYNNECVCVMQVRRLSGANYEISRFCPALNTNVIGGFSKLLKEVEKRKRTLPLETLKTYIDMRYGLGDYLTCLGFVEQKTFPSFKWTDGERTIHRLRFRGNSGYDKGLQKIWDCGQKPFLKVY